MNPKEHCTIFLSLSFFVCKEETDVVSVGLPPPTAPILPLSPRVRVLTHYPHKQAMLFGLKWGERKVLALQGSPTPSFIAEL